MKITIIGSGNIGSALVKGLLHEGTTPVGDVTLTDVEPEAFAPFATKGISVMQDNVEAVKNADMVVLCVKPYLVNIVAEDILPALDEDTLIISLAAGIDFFQLHRIFERRSQPLFRAIPNTAMSVCRSMTCIAASENTTPEQRRKVVDFFSRTGKAMLVDEKLMDAATILASCGTAFALRYLSAAKAAGVETGFRPAVAKEIVVQTMLGAAALIAESGNHPEVEIDKVTTPGGITIKGLNEMEHAGFSSAVMTGIMAAFEKICN